MVLLGGFLTNSLSFANKEISKKTGKACIYCHYNTAKPGNLKEPGKYYKEHRSLEGYTPSDSK